MPDAKIASLDEVEMPRTALNLAPCNGITHEPPGFGLWKDRSRDGLAYQENLRQEWET